MKVTFDTNALLSSTLWDGSVAQKLLFNLIRSNAEIFSSPDIIAEYQVILKREFSYSDEEVLSIIEKIFSFITLVTPTEKINAVKEDATDNKILECAVASNSEYIITYDKHLLKIKQFRDIKIVKPEDMIKML